LRTQFKTKSRNGEIHTVTFVDISYSWGPAIHFVELWNEYLGLSERPVVGHAVLEKHDRPYTETRFALKPLRLNFHYGRVMRRIRKLFFDSALFFHFLLSPPTTVYIRLSKFGIFLLLALMMRKHKVFLEVNGLALEDSTHSRTGNRRVVSAYPKLLERLYMKLPSATIITVAPQITATVVERYGVSDAVTIKNGCDRRLVDTFSNKRKSSHKELNIGFLGTFTPWDGHERTSDLYKALKRTGSGVVFHIGGPGVEATDLYREFHDNLDFLFYGAIPYKYLWRFYDRLDIAYAFDRIDRSKSVEQSTLKLLEYWACKIPIISTRALGNEFIEEYGFGVLLSDEELSDEELLIQRMLEFLQNIEQYRRNYEAAPRPRSWRDVAEDTQRVIETRSR